MLRGERDTGKQHQMPLPQTAEDRTATNQDRPVASYMTCSQRPISFTPNPVGLAHCLKDCPVRRPAASLHQALALLLFPGALQQRVTEMLKLRCPHGRATVCVHGAGLSSGRAGQDMGDKREQPSSAAALPGFAASAREGGGPTVPWGDRVSHHHWSEGHRWRLGIGWPGQMSAWDWSGTPEPLPGGGSAPLGPRAPGPSRPVRAGSGRCSSPAPLPHPHRGTCPAPGVWEQQWPPQAWPGPLTRDVDPAPRGQAAKARAGPDPEPTSYGIASFPPAPQKSVLRHQILKNLLQMLPRDLGSGESPPGMPTASGP